ncbi:hypothetical protein N8I77_002105 [Diaporthe amygdali]|uniref:Uncharacterized protein n=1 Tax=Phomopsis amygdali TaxID=1214568 RepID=A0AAD9SSS4_PHOAM|nr:hypothetical protein N8I77_002105 [Diaporthe amygdali]
MTPGIYRIPPEIVRKIAVKTGSRELASLALTARILHVWFSPYLYEHNIKHQNANAAVWAAENGRLDVLIRLYRTQPGSPPAFINKLWNGRKDFDRSTRSMLAPGNCTHVSSRMQLTLLHLAVRNGHDDMVIWLLQQGADVDARSNHLCFNPNVKDFNEETSLHYATKEPSGLTTIETLLNVGADPNGGDGDEPLLTPLYEAIVACNFEAANDLLRFGAKPWVHSKKVALAKRQKRRRGTPLQPLPLLHVALRTKEKFSRCRSERYEVCQRKIIRMLLDHGIDIDEKLDGIHARHLRETEGMTPLMMAAKCLDPITVGLLLERGAQVNLQNIDRASALRYALLQNAKLRNSRDLKKDTVKTLLEHGAELLDESANLLSIIMGSIPISKSMEQVFIDNMGPENLTTPGGASRALELCCIFQKFGLYGAIKQNSKVDMTENNIRTVLPQVNPRTRASVVAFLRRMHPELPLGNILDRMGFDVEIPWAVNLEGMSGSEDND